MFKFSCSIIYFCFNHTFTPISIFYLLLLILEGRRSSPTRTRSVLERSPIIFFKGGGSLLTSVGCKYLVSLASCGFFMRSTTSILYLPARCSSQSFLDWQTLSWIWGSVLQHKAQFPYLRFGFRYFGFLPSRSGYIFHSCSPILSMAGLYWKHLTFEDVPFLRDPAPLCPPAFLLAG